MFDPKFGLAIIESDYLSTNQVYESTVQEVYVKHKYILPGDLKWAIMRRTRCWSAYTSDKTIMLLEVFVSNGFKVIITFNF